MLITTLAWIVLGLPLAGALLLSLWPQEPDRALSRVVGVGTVAVGFIFTVIIFADLLTRNPSQRHATNALWQWINVDGLHIDLAIFIDPLSVMMMLIITGVGSLIVWYSTEYMAEDRDYRRFFAEMNFFVFSMLLLVMAGNFFFLIVGWAFVGLASYLLIGYYYEKPSAVAAAKKAFVINVIGDVGLVLGAFLIAKTFGTLDYQAVFNAAPTRLPAGSFTAEMICLLLFVGCAAKSAQIPLHTWLPDAMEGPTPVSALIHAATMVTAGVYLIVRCNVLFHLAPYASDYIAITGAVTLLVAASIAIVQEDIKRVLAWSTVSQIGYMMLAAGLGFYSQAMFHLLMHAFFKALLFLTAGVVIHALAGEQSLNRMGGLHRLLKFASFAMLVGCLAISGIPPFSGFFSKDEILSSAMAAGPLGVVCGTAGIIGAAMTAFYMFRLYFRAFSGPERDGGYHPHPHMPGVAMTIPVGVLAVLATVGGFLQVPWGRHLINTWLAPSIPAESTIEPSVSVEWITSIVCVVLAGAAIWLAWWLFAAGPERRLKYATTLAGLRTLLLEQWLFDPAYESVIIEPGRQLGDAAIRTAEPDFTQGIVRVATGTTMTTAGVLRRRQSGLVRTYAFAMIAGAAILGIIVVLAR
jgi:NADH-quinone oxidoreductase subunit L